MIRAYCYSETLNYENEKWPRFFGGIPNIGDLVKSERGVVLTIAEIIHCTEKVQRTGFEADGYDEVPYIDIELK